MRRLLAFLSCALGFTLVACGGREHPAPKALTEGPDIYTAALTCNTDRVKELLDHDPHAADDPRYKFAKDYPLQQAVETSNICGSGTVRLLLERIPDTNVNQLNAALVTAAGIGNAEVVDLLLQHGADANAYRAEPFVPGTRMVQETPMHRALRQHHSEVAQQLLAAGARPDIYDAAALGDVRVIRAEIERDPNLATKHGPEFFYDLPIDWARRYHQRDAERLLLDNMPDADLIEIISGDDASRVRDYVTHNPGSVNLVDDRYRTPLFYAVDSGDREIVQYLIEHGADLKPWYLLQPAVINGDTDMVKLLLEKGYDVKHYTYVQQDIQRAIREHHTEIADALKKALEK